MKKLILFLLTFLLLTACRTKNPALVNNKPKLAFLNWSAAPPMGWNSWDCYGPTVVESEVKANADFMAKNLKEYGWQYIVIDIRWYIENDKAGGYNESDARYVMDKYGRYQPAVNRFPSSAGGKGFKPVGDYIHNAGLKFGIHIMRGIPVLAVKQNLHVYGTNVKAQDIYSTEGQCKWLKDNYTVDSKKEGAQAYYNSLFKMYAEWGIDFVKVDDLAGHLPEIEMVRKAIDNCGRQIVLSISPGPARIEDAEFLTKNANMWRTVDDFWDNWPQLKPQFAICAAWAPYIGEGHFPDADMLPLGKIGIRAERGAPRMTGFTKDEQFTVMTLFAIFRSPLMFGGDLQSMDPFTLALITNKDVLKVNQKSMNNRQLFRKDDLIVWTADDQGTSDKYLALFNATDSSKKEISVKFDQIGLNGAHTVTDLWTGNDLGSFTDEFTQTINAHGAGLYRIQ
jgi:alpha-galactosidase